METARDKLLASLCDLVLQRGFAAASVDAICQRAGVSKGSFFHHFKNKEEAAQATLTWFFANMNDRVAAQLPADATPRQRVLAFLDGFIAMMKSPGAPPGCLIGTLALEVSGSHPDIRQQVVSCFDQTADNLVPLLQQALGDKKRRRAKELADHFVSVMQGGLLLAKARQNPQVAVSAIEHYKQYLLTIMDQQ